MKMILAIVNDDDSSAVSSALASGGFQVTKLSTTGGLLRAGNTTFISGVDDDKVDAVVNIIAENSSKRKQIIPSSMTVDMDVFTSFPVEINVGGAALFVLDVDRFIKV